MTLPKTRGACTIVSPNYLAYARVVASSYRKQHPEDRFFVLLVASLTDASPFAQEPFEAVVLDQIGLDNVRAEAMKYDLLELNTNVKPTFLKYLLRTYGLDEIVYLDPDIFVYAPLEPVFDALITHDAVLTPHVTAPVYDGKSPSEQDLLVNGTYNLGFFAVRNSPGGARVLDWWERRCLDEGYSEGRSGLFVDQKWMNLAPGMFDVATVRDPGLNMAYWNLQERTLHRMQDGGLRVLGPEGEAPLRFFHFSGLDPRDGEMLSRNTDRFTLAERPDVQAIFAEYKAAVLAAKDARLEAIPYGFDTFSDGTVVTRLSRRIFAVHAARFAGPHLDPFDAQGPWARWARKAGLLAGKAAPAKETWTQFSGQDRRVDGVHRLLRWALRVLGPNRYELLMRYLGHISILRNQGVFLDKDLP